MVAEQQDHVVRPRNYQWEIFEQAIKENVIAYLDTGSGKTLISILLIKERYDQLTERGIRKQLFFLAPKVGLVKQQANVLREHTELDVGDYCGDMKVDWWTIHRWRNIFMEKDVIVCTPAILLSLLRRSFIKMKDIDLIVFDECHHCKKADPYNCIMQEWYFDATLKGSDKPHILGLTASPLDTKSVNRADHVRQFFRELEQNLDARIITVSNQDEVRDAAPLPASRTEYYSPITAKATTPNTPTLKTLEILRKIHKLLREEREARESELKEATHNWVAEDSRWLDHDLPTSETARFEQTVGRIIHAFEEVGGYGALITFAEMLQPTSRNIYQAIGKASKQQNEELAQLKALDINMVSDNIDEDAWWQGANSEVAEKSSRKVELNQKEEKSLCHILAFLYNQFAKYLEMVDLPGLPTITDQEAMAMLWAGLRKHLREQLFAFEKTIDRKRLVTELKSDQPETNPKAIVTPKAATMIQVLSKYKAHAVNPQLKASETTKGWSCIIFAEQKVACLAISRLLRACEEELGFVRATDLMGSSDRIPALSHSTALQGDTLAKFKSGDCNVMVATSVAEEGLDNCHCSLIVRFTLPKTACQFIQSRGRARARGSEMVLMCQRSNASQSKIIEDLSMFEKVMLTEAVARAKLPNPARDFVEDVTDEDIRDLPISDTQYRVEATGACISISSAKSLLFQYCSKLPSDCYTGDLRPKFSTESKGAMFKTVVYLPHSAHAKKAEGIPKRTRALAISAACLKAIELLHQAGGFTDHLIPTGTDLEPEEDEFHLGPIGALRESAATRLCRICPKWPELLKRSPSDTQTSSFLYRIVMEKISTPQKGYPAEFWRQAIGVVVPQKLPDLPEVTPYIDDQKRVKVKLQFQFVGEVELSSEEVVKMKRFHDFLQHRNPTVSDLCARRLPGAVEERTKKARLQKSRQKFQEVSPESGKMSDVLAEEWSKRGTMEQTRFYEDALMTAKQYAEQHGMMPRDPMEELVAGTSGAAYDPSAEGLEMRNAMMASGAYKLYQKEEKAVEEFGKSFQSMTKQERKKLDWTQRYEEEGFVEEDDPNEVANGHAVNGHANGVDEKTEEPRWIEEVLGFASAGAVVVPLTQDADDAWKMDWPAIDFAYEPPSKISDVSDSDLKDCLLAPTYVQMSFQRVLRRRHDLTPLSHTTVGIKGSPTSGEENFAHRMRRKYQITGLDLSQNLVEVGHLSMRPTTEEMCFIPELCVLHPLKLPAYQLALFVPRLLWWLHALLLGAELQAKLAEASSGQHPVPTIGAITEALMSKSCDSDFNYERLEIIGDAFLKFEASLHCYRAFPTSHEGQLHNVKIKLVCNKHLAKIALELLELDKYIIVPPTNFRWDVGHSLPTAKVKRKVVADVLEALLGAYFMACGIEGTADFMRDILLLPEETRHPRLSSEVVESTPSTGMATKLEALLQYKFKNRQILRESCTHPSWKEDDCATYERLEFLGDAIIDVYVVRALAETYKDISPGMVSDIREAAVNNTRLACVAAAYRCHHALRHSSTALLQDIGSFVKLFDTTLRQNTDADLLKSLEGDKTLDNKALGKTYDQLTDLAYGLKVASAPKVMADLVESLVGAVYIDADCQLETSFKVLNIMMDPLPKPETVPLHPVRVLVEKSFQKGFIMKFNIRTGVNHTYHVDAYICLYLLASVENCNSRKSGKITAARKALERWSDEADYDAMPGQAFDTEKTELSAAFAKAVKAARPDLLTAGPGRINLTYEDHALKPRVKILSINTDEVD